MVLSDLSIRRPVLATVMSLTVVLLGIPAYERLPVRKYSNRPGGGARPIGAPLGVIWTFRRYYIDLR